MECILKDHIAIINGRHIEIANCVFISVLGEGSNSIVLHAYDTLLDCDIEVKIWLNKGQDTRDKLLQGMAEAQKLSSLKHQHIVTIYRASIQSNA